MWKWAKAPTGIAFDIFSVKCKEWETFENQLIFDTEDWKNVEDDKKAFVELDDDSDQEVDISHLNSLIKPVEVIEPRKVLHSYTENTGGVINMKRKKLSEHINDSKANMF